MLQGPEGFKVTLQTAPSHVFHFLYLSHFYVLKIFLLMRVWEIHGESSDFAKNVNQELKNCLMTVI